MYYSISDDQKYYRVIKTKQGITLAETQFENADVIAIKYPPGQPKLSGLAYPKHQEILSYMTHNILNLIKANYYNHYSATSETYIIINDIQLNGIYYKKKQLIPDITVWDISCQHFNYESPLIFIEICNNKDMTSNLSKMLSCLKYIDSLQECFTYNYVSNKFFKLFKNNHNKILIQENNSFSEILKADFNNFINF